MSRNKWVRSISFNKTNPDDVRRLELIGDSSFSKFVKNLIDRELERQDQMEKYTPTYLKPKPDIYQIREEKLRRS